MITLKNTFHGTSINLRPRDSRLSVHQVRRARRILCGIDGCTCGGPCGERGAEYVTYADPWGGATVEPRDVNGGWI